MKKSLLILPLLALFLTIASIPASANTPEERITGSVRILQEMAKQQDVGHMAHLLSNARGVAIFPSVVKAGLVIGGRYGEGLLLKYDPKAKRWYGPNFITIAGASWGLQIGVQSTALVLVITNDRGMDGFVGNKVTLGGDFAVAAGPMGRSAQAATDGKLQASIYSYSMSKGLFAGLSLEGAAVSVDENANSVYWGGSLSARQALDKRATSSKIQPLVKELNGLLSKAK
ncbi:lipid-binding SYLF domain-containing protein [Aminithiophilus ramosus]|uniref:Lipid-binding SYLF domain-containing protein n=2 Tax=Synergistales TaxID=649776 RepID=A0A9Q7EX28_9BACT|nr:lipid-binding SYLF domain-containing protein [Aminithiophilus ramosus]QTX33294.1 lipid-binding SYLF domain-containing protein [Aminithiophilus ramosus]QVL36958.1 lipid-binding SYLF domain-containing protein [Synergistota bacterium]